MLSRFLVQLLKLTTPGSLLDLQVFFGADYKDVKDELVVAQVRRQTNEAKQAENWPLAEEMLPWILEWSGDMFTPNLTDFFRPMAYDCAARRDPTEEATSTKGGGVSREARAGGGESMLTS